MIVIVTMGRIVETDNGMQDCWCVERQDGECLDGSVVSYNFIKADWQEAKKCAEHFHKKFNP